MKGLVRRIFLLAMMAIFLSAVNATAFSLPDPGGTILGGADAAHQYTDFYSYSLPLLALDYDINNGGGTGPGNPYYVVSTPGAIKDDIVLYTGADGKPVNTNYAGMDNAYPTPNGSTYTAFSTAIADDPNPSFTGDSAFTWDTQLSALTNYLEGDDLIFFFNNNEENSESTLSQILVGRAIVSLVDSDGTNTPIDLYFINNDTTFGQEDGLDWVVSPGNIHIDGYGDINHNLGANQAAFAITSLDLSDWLRDWDGSTGYDTMQVRFDLAELSNGYEQLFIQRAEHATNVVPEPATMLLLGLGLLGLAGISRKQRK